MAIDREKIQAAAQKYVEKKKYDRAVAEYLKIIQEDPNDARTLLKIGDLQSKMEQYAEAVETYEKVGKSYASQGFSLKAIAVYKQIREIISKHVPQLENSYSHVAPKLAELYTQLGLTSDALAALDEVATRLQKQNRDTDAIEVFRRIVDLDPTNPLPHLRLAEALSRAKEVDGAVLEFGIAAGQLLKLGRRDDALKVIERLLHHKTDPSHARIAAEHYLARNGPNDGMQALAKLQLCFQANPRDLDTLGLLARAFTQIGQDAKAIEVHKETARLARDTGKMDVFEQTVETLLRLAPRDEAVREFAASREAVAGAEELSEDAYEEVATGDVDEPDEDLRRRQEARTETAQGVVVERTIDVDDYDGGVPEASPEQVAAILEDAAAFRQAREHAKAIETLRGGLDMSPRTIELHDALREVLLDAGHTEDAIATMLTLASLQIDALDGDGAARTLQEVMALDPANARAAEMLRELGYELVEEPAPNERQVDLPPMRPEHASYSSYDPEAPLPSYDLEEIGPEHVSARSQSEASFRAAPAVARPRSANIDEMDDPFGDGPLPSFPLEAPSSEAVFELAPEGDSDGALAAAAPAPARRGPTPELEAALDEAEFFASRGLFDDARAILDEQLARLPNHPLILERLAEIDEQVAAAGGGGSGARPSPSAHDGAAEDDHAFDIAESLGATEAADSTSGVASGAGLDAQGGGPIDVEEVFAKFKEGVAKQIDVDDAQSHYDLGVAYKEMALLDDAIREFDTAARDPRRTCICRSMIGAIEIERGNLDAAIEAFAKGLVAQERTKEQEAALAYEIGAAYEVKRQNKQALDYFQRCARTIPGFRDVQERIRRLQKTEPKPATRQVAVGADDEFDRAFDDIIDTGKQS